MNNIFYLIFGGKFLHVGGFFGEKLENNERKI
jgi:hypothetical protein